MSPFDSFMTQENLNGPQWNVKVKIETLDRGNITVKNRWVVGDTVTVQIEGHASVNMLKQRIALLVAAHPNHQTITNQAKEALDDNTKLQDCPGVTDGSIVLLNVQQPKEEEVPPVVISDDEEVWEEGPEAEPLPDADLMSKELSEEEQDQQNKIKGEGAELLEDGDKEGALAKYTAAIMVGAPSALMLAKRAEILLKLKRPKAAAADATAAIGINPDSAKAYKLRGKARRYLGDYEGAVADLNSSQKQDYDDGVADMHSYLQKRIAKMRLKAQQDSAKAAKAEQEAKEAKGEEMET